MDKNEFELWQMDAKIGLEGNVFRAMEVYARKFGQQADLVFANPIDLLGKKLDCVGFEVQAMTNVQPGTLWVGRKDNE